MTPRRGSSKTAVRIEMDMQLAQQYWDFYHGHEPLLDICRNLRHDNTFKGPVQIEWGGGDIKAIRLDGAGEQDDLKTLFRAALEWRDLFGMVPLIMRRRAKRRAGRPLVSIPPFGTGRFVIEFDTRDLTSTIVYEVSVRVRSGTASRGPNIVNIVNTRAQAGKRSSSSATKTLPVFVWPGHEPNIMNGQFRSTIQSLLAQFSRITQLRENLLVADRAAARPVLFTESRPDKTTLEQQTERELLGAVGDPGVVSPGERTHYMRDVHRAMRQEAMTAATNAASRGVVSTTVDPNSHRVVNPMTSAWSGSVEPLPDGETIARTEVPKSRSDIHQFEDRYAEVICLAMGIPYGYIRGGGGARIKGETDLMRSIFRSAISRDRSDVNIFYSWVHETMHRGKDDTMLNQALLQAEEAEGVAITSDELARIDDVRANIQAISSMPQRVQVVFPEDPLPRAIDLSVLQLAAQAGVIDATEHANALRAELGLPSIDADHPLLRRVDADAPPEQRQMSETERSTGSSSSSSAAATSAAAAAIAEETPTEDIGKQQRSKASETKKRRAGTADESADVDLDKSAEDKDKEPTTVRRSKRRRR